MGLSNRSLLQKADLALADLTAGGGILLPAQAKKFIRLLIKQSVLMGMATVVPMAAPKQQIPKTKFGSRIMRPGQEGTALAQADRAKPDLSYVELDTVLLKAEVHLTDEVLEDNIERGELRQTILEMIAERAAVDAEELFIQGDKNSTDPYLALLHGLLVQAQSHVVDAGSTPIGKDLLHDVLKTIPSEYLRNKKLMKFLTSVDNDLNYRNTLADRATIGGDVFLTEDTPVLYSGVPVTPIPLFPENMGAKGNTTDIILADPKNIFIGIWRQIRIEYDRLITEGTLRIVATMRVDVKYADENGVAKIVNVTTN
jgi:HK97 family phage major capsid protein